MVFDCELLLSFGSSRLATSWEQKKTTWSEFCARIRQPKRGAETCAEYDKKSKDEQVTLKDVGGYVAGELRDGRRKAAHVVSRSLVGLDVDTGSWERCLDYLMWCGHAWAMHTTRAHRANKERLRILVPLARSVSPDEYEAIARRLAQRIGIDMMDPSTYQPERLFFWPSVCSDGPWRVEINDEEILKPEEVLDYYSDWRDRSNWPTAKNDTVRIPNAAKKAEDPLTKNGIVGLFCSTYDINRAILDLIPGVYIPTEQTDRWTYAGGSSTGGALVYESKWLYSWHGTDPARERLLNAWDLVRVHKFGHLDESAAPGCPVTRLPSTTAMRTWASSLPEIAKIDAAKRIERARSDYAEGYQEFEGAGSKNNEGASSKFEQPDTELPSNVVQFPTNPRAHTPPEKKTRKTDPDWQTKISRNPTTGLPKPTAENIRLILENEPAFAGKLGFDDFAGRPTVKAPMPWDRGRKFPRDWSDTDDSHLGHYLETYWSIVSERATNQALAIVMDVNAYHPVKEYLAGLVWDGKPRLDTVLSRYLGAEDNSYTRAITRKAITAAVARVRDPGCQMDYMLTLVGGQGPGKSSFIRALGGAWYSDSVYTVQGKEAYEALQGVWIAEMPELAATKRADVEAVKHFISKRSDSYRPAYGRRTVTHPRQNILIATTNDYQSLTDTSGNRRFWMANCGSMRGPEQWMQQLLAERDQLWAEAVVRYEQGEALFLQGSEAQAAAEVQSQHMADDGLTIRIADWLEELVPPTWEKMPQKQRSKASALGLSSAPEPDWILRHRVRAMDVWEECLSGRADNFTRAQAKRINEVLRNLGWKETSIRVGTVVGKGFLRPTAQQKAG